MDIVVACKPAIGNATVRTLNLYAPASALSEVPCVERDVGSGDGESRAAATNTAWQGCTGGIFERDPSVDADPIIHPRHLPGRTCRITAEQGGMLGCACRSHGATVDIGPHISTIPRHCVVCAGGCQTG